MVPDSSQLFRSIVKYHLSSVVSLDKLSTGFPVKADVAIPNAPATPINATVAEY